MTATVLAGDVGGTKIHLGLYRATGDDLVLLQDQVYATHDYPNLEVPLAEFLRGGEKPAAACLGVPGPVVDGMSRPTNIPWQMHEKSLAERLHGVPVRLLNDLEATAWGTLHLRDSDLVMLQEGQRRDPPANMVVIAAGTGLGEGGMVYTRNGWHVVASEGGHTDFAPRGEDQEQLLHFLARDFEHVSFERLVSGLGLPNIYRFLLGHMPGAEPDWLAMRMRTDDPSVVIGEVGVVGKEPRCARALEIFVAIYGAEAANLALKYLALGGVYVCGGIAPKILPTLQNGSFIRAFLDKGRLRSTLEQMPVRVSINQNTGLIGAAHAAAAML